MRIRIQKGFFTSAIGLAILGIVFVLIVTAGGIFTYYYMKYSRMIDARLSGNILQNTTQIFSAPEHISVDQAWSPEDLAAYLTRVGYRTDTDANALGQFTVDGTTVDIRPSKLSYFAGKNALAVQFRGKSIKSIRPLGGGNALDTAEIEPELITNLFDSAREKRRPVRYEDLPVTLVDAILSAEDKRFSSTGDSTSFASRALRGRTCATPASTTRARARSPCRWRAHSFFPRTETGGGSWRKR